MLKSLFTSSVRVKLLKHFFLHPSEEFFVRQLTRDLNEQVNAVRRELENWKKIGLLKSSSRGGKKFYSLNSNFLIYQELSSIILKSFVVSTDIKRDLENLGEIDYLYLSGVFINKKSSVDMLIVGDIEPSKIQAYLNAELGEKEVKFSVISKTEFNYRLDINDSFLLSIVRDKDAVILVNRLKKKLEKYI